MCVSRSSRSCLQPVSMSQMLPSYDEISERVPPEQSSALPPLAEVHRRVRWRFQRVKSPIHAKVLPCLSRSERTAFDISWSSYRHLISCGTQEECDWYLAATVGMAWASKSSSGKSKHEKSPPIQLKLARWGGSLQPLGRLTATQTPCRRCCCRRSSRTTRTKPRV